MTAITHFVVAVANMVDSSLNTCYFISYDYKRHSLERLSRIDYTSKMFRVSILYHQLLRYALIQFILIYLPLFRLRQCADITY